MYIHSMLEEDEASYLDSGPVIDSREGGLEVSVSKLEDGMGSAGGDAVGKPPAKTLEPRHGMSEWKVYSLQMGAWVPTLCPYGI